MHATKRHMHIIIGGLNIGDFSYESQLPKFTPRQYFVLYGSRT